MKLPSSNLLFGCAALMALPTLSIAQTVLPTIATNVHGNDGQNRHFEDNPFRSQQVVLGSALVGGGTAIVMNGIGYRPENAPTGATFTDIVIRVGNTTQTPEFVDATFANNFSGTLTTVWDSSVNGPITIPPYTNDILNPAPFFDIEFRNALDAAAPFVFDVTHPDGPNLIIDCTSAVDPGGNVQIDGARAGGHWQNFGQSGDVSMPDPFAQFRLLGNGVSKSGAIGGNRSGMVPGDCFSMICTAPSYMDGTPAAWLFGIGPNPAPVDLTVVGAASNFLYTANHFTIPATWTFSPIQGLLTTQDIAPGPATPIGFQYNAQLAAIDIPANSLGVVTSNGLEMHIGEPGINHPVGQVASSDHTAASGFVQYGTSAGIWGGAVLKVY